VDDGDEPIADKIAGLKKELFSHFEESARLDRVVRDQMSASMSETLIGHVPDEWQSTTLGELCASGGGISQTGPFWEASYMHRIMFQRGYRA